MKTYSGAIVETNKGIALQLRDDKPDIVNPGRITPFGGHIEPGETPLTCVVRELAEELELIVPAVEVLPLGTYFKTVARDGEDAECHTFLVRDVDADTLRLHEGQAIYYLTTKDQLTNPLLTNVCKWALNDYFAKFTR